MIVDTGPLVAAANRREPDHPACRDLLTKAPGQLTIPALVVAEATFMIERAGGPAAEARFIRSSDRPDSGSRRRPTTIWPGLPT